jgi:dTDP-4-amino-4,6-dideoxygalactose transaminase
LAECGLNLPTYNNLSLEDVGYIADHIRSHGQAKHG